MQIRRKSQGKFSCDNRLLNLKILNYFTKIRNSCLSTYCKNSIQTTKVQLNETQMFQRT